MRRLALFAAAVTLACGSNPSTIPAGDFSGPTALAIAPLADRDLLFIANQGSNEMRAMTLCHTPNASTCPTAQDFQFLPAPIRVFPASILTGERPLRLAGVPLSDGTLDATSIPPKPIANHGAVLVAALAVDGTPSGLDAGPPAEIPALQLFDAVNLLTASQGNPAASVDPRQIELPAFPVDVVASDVPNTTVTAFAISQTA